MKTSILAIIFIMAIMMLTNILLLAQNTGSKIDPRIYTRYDENMVKESLANDPASMDFVNFMVKSSYYILDYSKEPKPEAYSSKIYPQLQKINNKTKAIIPYTITEQDLGNFNIFEYDFKIDTERTIYKLGNTTKLLIVYSHQEITDMFNKSRGF